MPNFNDFGDYRRAIKPIATSSKHYTVLALGDSWFKYPNKYSLYENSNIIDHLENEDRLLIDNESKNGAELLQLLSGDNKITTLSKVYTQAQDNNPLDIILLSGGGNDIVGEFDLNWILKPQATGDEKSPADYIRQDHLSAKVAQLQSALTEFSLRVASLSPYTHIITHNYDIPFPSDKSTIIYGIHPFSKSWIKPYMDAANIPSQDQRPVIEYLLKQLGSAQTAAAAISPNLKPLDNHGVLNNNPGLWRDEIHPTPQGFKIIADKFKKAIFSL